MTAPNIRSTETSAYLSRLAEEGMSIIIPNYNHGIYLTDAIRSRLAQNVEALEVIVVDDASTDDSVTIVEREAERDSRLRLVRRPKNGGPNAAICSGLAIARGCFVTFSAADDVLDPKFAEYAVAALKQFPQAAFSFMDPSLIYEDSEERISIPLALSTQPTYLSPSDFGRLMHKNYFTISSNTVSYRRGDISEIGGYRTDLEWQADWLANLVLAFRKGACYVPASLATVRIHVGTYSWNGLREPHGQRRLLYRCLDAIAIDYPDVKSSFRKAALIPEMRLRDLFWLMNSARHRSHITPRLIARLFAREIWEMVRPYCPLWLRQWWRRRRAAASRSGNDFRP